MNKPLWMHIAEQYIGQREIKGVTHNTLIVGWWKKIKRGGIKTDEVPWCAAFVGAMLEDATIKSSRFESAKSYLSWGTKLDKPAYGCVVVFSRDGGGHVGFVTGQDARGRLLVLGGNQSDMVSIRSFVRDNVVGYRWPHEVPLPDESLPIASAESSGSVV